MHQFDRFGSFFELFFRFGFCNFSSFAFGTNCTTHVNSSWELDNTWQFRKKWGVKRQIVFFAWMIKYFGKVPRKGFVKVLLWQISILFLIYKEIPEDTQISCDSWHFKKVGVIFIILERIPRSFLRFATHVTRALLYFKAPSTLETNKFSNYDSRHDKKALPFDYSKKSVDEPRKEEISTCLV